MSFRQAVNSQSLPSLLAACKKPIQQSLQAISLTIGAALLLNSSLSIAESTQLSNAKLAPLEVSTRLVFTRCLVGTGAYEIDAECADFVRHENPNDDNSKLITLAVIKLPALTPEPEQDAFTIIQGGPGGSSIDLAVAFSPAFEDIRRKRDIIVIDQRGTGRSNKLGCTPPEDNPSEFDPQLAKQLTQVCLDKLSIHSDVRYYTTSVAVDDLEALRKAAGYTQFNIYGTSYGTRVAQHYLRKYPTQTRSLIIDGVAHVGLNFAGGEIARRWQDRFETLNARCKNSPSCFSQHGDLQQSYDEIYSRLEQQTAAVELAHPTTGNTIEYTLNKDSLFGAIRLMAYSSSQSALIPILLSKAKAGDYTFFASQIIQMEESFPVELASGMHNAVVCTEDTPYVTSEDLAPSSGTILGSLMSEALAASCSIWPRGVMDKDFRTPFSSEVPVLVLSGATDPITPPANGDIAANMLGNARHVIVPAHGHGVIARGCVTKLASNFIHNGNFNDFDSSCVDREHSVPIFSTLTGARP
jgi:pimeloyl-ACP methyl ester carboxylesterase